MRPAPYAASVPQAVGDALPGDVGPPRPIARWWPSRPSFTGIAQRAMEMAVNYAKERKQFDRPIGTYQALAHVRRPAQRRGRALLT